MNLLKFLPKKARESYESNLLTAGIENFNKFILRAFLFGFILALLIAIIAYFINSNVLIALLVSFILIEIIIYFVISLKASSRLKKMEDSFPDFIQLMASNLRAGMTIDKAFLSAARPEFEPLDKEVIKTGREIMTGQDIVVALKNMQDRINSEKIKKTLYLIISGLKAGGNISVLLETTASNMKEKEFLEKRASSNVLMYVIFIFAAIGLGAPLLFGLSSVLVDVLIRLTAQMPDIPQSNMNMPITFTKITLSQNFMLYFSIIFLLSINLISALVIGLVNKGKEKEGLKYFIPLAFVSLLIFFAIRFFFSNFISQIFGVT